jgi:uncharacterized membrane protein
MSLPRVLQGLLAVFAMAGLFFSGVSTSDFTAHLDRQTHGLHCSFIPGADTPDVTGTSGCHATLMSPYSSVLRDSVWGGIPVSLPSMAVFAYLAVCAITLLLLSKESEKRATGYQALAWALPFLTSCIFGYLSLHELDAACKICIGIYASSTLGMVTSIIAFVKARSSAPLDAAMKAAAEEEDERVIEARSGVSLASLPTGAEDTIEDLGLVPPIPAVNASDETAASAKKLRLATASEMDRRLRAGNVNRRKTVPTGPAPTSWGALALAFVIGLGFVLIPVGAYAMNAPDFDHFVGACGTLAHPEDAGRVLVPLGPQTREATMVEVLDPLCPSCRGFERRFSAHPAAGQMSRKVLLFPLDGTCNWMVDGAVHPGACVVSEAVLCAEDDAEEVLAWAFEHQEEIRTATTADAGAAARMVNERFPNLHSCIGSARVQAQLNRSLRWAVANQLPVLTPQVYVNNTRICDEDTDLGVDYVLTRLLDRGAE